MYIFINNRQSVWYIMIIWTHFGVLTVTTVTVQIVNSVRFGELAVNSNSAIFRVVKLWRVRLNFTYTECLYTFTACLTECLLFLCWSNPLIIYFKCHQTIEHTMKTLLGILGMISDVKLRKATFLLENRMLLSTFGYDKLMIRGDK